MRRAVYEEKLIDGIIASVEKHGGNDCLSSIVLTGSFGRGEPTYFTESNGELKLKSDVEIALIYPNLFQKKQIQRLMHNVSAEFEENLNLMPLNENRVRKTYNFNFSFRVPKYKTIFTYDFFNGSKTIWGRNFLKEKNISLAEVDPYEAKRLVANRIGELVYLSGYENGKEKDFLRKQWKGKLVLAIASAWLICNREYVSSYSEQNENLKKNVEKIEKLMGEGFWNEYDAAFSFLRESGEVYEIPDYKLMDYIKRIDQYFNEKNLKIPKVNSTSRRIKYIVKYCKTGMKYGIIGFENNILQALIEDYWKQSKRVFEDADIWYRVLY